MEPFQAVAHLVPRSARSHEALKHTAEVQDAAVGEIRFWSAVDIWGPKRREDLLEIFSQAASVSKAVSDVVRTSSLPSADREQGQAWPSEVGWKPKGCRQSLLSCPLLSCHCDISPLLICHLRVIGNGRKTRRV